MKSVAYDRERGDADTASMTGDITPIDPTPRGATKAPGLLHLALAAPVLLIYLALFRGPALLEHARSPVVGGALLLFVVVTPTLWGLVHEAIHGRLARSPPANRMAGRALCVLLGFSFETVQFGHLTHHRYNGHEYDRPDRVKPGEPAWLSWSRHLGHLLGGHYLFTALVSLMAFAPAALRQHALRQALPGPQADIVAIRQAALKWFANPRRIRRMRIDCALSVLLIALAITAYASAWPALLAALYARAVLYSTFDNLPHYGTQGRGDQASKNLTLPRWASFIVLNHNLHRVHHEQPQLSWRALPAHLGPAATDGNYLLAALRQFAGPTRA
jgi:fatty acid desaturase